MRTFLAIAIPDDIKNRLTAACQRLAPVASDVTWSKRDQFHLTLGFLGETSPAILPHLTVAIERVCTAFPAFVGRVYGFGFFGTKRNPKTLWAGVDLTPELDRLHEQLWVELKKFGYVDDEQDFRPHITLGRCRESTRNHPVIEAMDADEECSFGDWEITRVTLYESRLTPHGPLYRNLRHIELA